MEHTHLLSEKLRPNKLTDIILPEEIHQRLKKMVEAGWVMNMLFYGGPGIGKTSAAKILINEIGADFYEINGSFNNGDKGMVKKIEAFASTMSLLDGPKICFIDEADQMSREVQDSLRYIIEKCSATTRFILTANEISKMTPAIKSRCAPMRFDVPPHQVRNVIERMSERYEERLADLGYDVTSKRTKEVVSNYFPDLRSIANAFQMELG